MDADSLPSNTLKTQDRTKSSLANSACYETCKSRLAGRQKKAQGFSRGKALRVLQPTAPSREDVSPSLCVHFFNAARNFKGAATTANRLSVLVLRTTRACSNGILSCWRRFLGETDYKWARTPRISVHTLPCKLSYSAPGWSAVSC